MTARRRKYILIAIAVLVICFVGYKIFKQNFLQHKLPALVESKTHQLYTINYDSISVDEIGGDLYIKNLYVKGDTAQQLAMLSAGDTNAVKVLLDVYIPLLKVKDFKTAKAVLSKQLDCRQIVVLNPQVHMYIFPGAKESDVRKQQQQLYNQLLGNFRQIRADSIAIVNAAVTAQDFYTKEIKFQTAGTTVALDDVAIDSIANQDTTRTLFCRQIKIKSDRVSLGEKQKSAEITNFMFDTRSQLFALGSFSYDAYKNDGFFKSSAECITLKGFEWTGPVENSALTIADAVIEKGKIETSPSHDDASSKGSKSAKPILTGWLRKCSIGNLRAKSITFIKQPEGPEKQPLSIANNAFVVTNLHIDSTASFGGNLFNHTKEVELTNNQVNIRSQSGLYVYSFGGIKLNTLRKTLFIKSLRIIPQYGKDAFMKKSKYQTDRYDATVDNLLFTNMNMGALQQGKMFAESGSITRMVLKVYRDLNYRLDSASRIGARHTFPHQLLHTFDLPVKIARFDIHNADLGYEEREILSNESGNVRFVKSHITLTNISNQPVKPGEKLVMRFTTKFLGNIDLRGSISFYLDEWRSGKFAAEASTSDTIDATMINQLTMPMSMARVEKGTIYPVQFSMTADTALSHGRLVFPYENLKLSLLKKKGTEYKKKDVMSLLGNLLVKNSNKPGNKLRIAEVEVRRNIYGSFFHFIWTTIFQGINDTMRKIKSKVKQ